MCRLFVCMVALSAIAGFAQATKEAATASSVVIMRSAPCPTVPNPPGCGAPNWIDLLSTTIKPPGGKDLFITFSSVVGLFTLGSNTASGPPLTRLHRRTRACWCGSWWTGLR